MKHYHVISQSELDDVAKKGKARVKAFKETTYKYAKEAEARTNAFARKLLKK